MGNSTFHLDYSSDVLNVSCYTHDDDSQTTTAINITFTSTSGNFSNLRNGTFLLGGPSWGCLPVGTNTSNGIAQVVIEPPILDGLTATVSLLTVSGNFFHAFEVFNLTHYIGEVASFPLAMKLGRMPSEAEKVAFVSPATAASEAGLGRKLSGYDTSVGYAPRFPGWHSTSTSTDTFDAGTTYPILSTKSLSMGPLTLDVGVTGVRPCILSCARNSLFF